MADYSLLGFEPSHRKLKKYDAILQNKKTKEKIRVPFGDKRYENFTDKTGLDLYPTHSDPVRRARYRKRHRGYLRKGFYSPGWFSWNMLW